MRSPFPVPPSAQQQNPIAQAQLLQRTSNATGFRQSLPGQAFNQPARSTHHGLGPVETLMIEKSLMSLYPKLHFKRLPVIERFSGDLIPRGLIDSVTPDIRRIVIMYCGEGLLCNILSLVFPNIEIVGIDPRDKLIAAAQKTVHGRDKLTFVHGHPNTMPEIPCDRIIYDHALAALGSTCAFKKLVLKTTHWLVNEGDWIIQESPWRLFQNRQFLKELFPKGLQSGMPQLQAYLQSMMSEIGYDSTRLTEVEGFPGIPARLMLHAGFQPSLSPATPIRQSASQNFSSRTPSRDALRRQGTNQQPQIQRKATQPVQQQAQFNVQGDRVCPLDDLFTGDLELAAYKWHLN